MARARADNIRIIETSGRMGLKAPALLTFLASFVVMLAVLFAKYFNATIPYLGGDVTQFGGLLVAYVILAMGCLFSRF